MFEAKAIIFTVDFTWPISDNGNLRGARIHMRSSIMTVVVGATSTSIMEKINFVSFGLCCLLAFMENNVVDDSRLDGGMWFYSCRWLQQCARNILVVACQARLPFFNHATTFHSRFNPSPFKIEKQFSDSESQYRLLGLPSKVIISLIAQFTSKPIHS